ncbi:Gfo/Idh/MocA family protein [Halalkalibacter urbisdiaboli]|uniref:Gfo/Idh/MocA family protein n=1 Tax=Halalkalibacter urbisdiaboli TaxID=1960589 RepID=UPI000B441F0E|nr:Gfo/Idh/MocA family oxidoreductase [Halalkalibacter urbisdiaboli]
MKKLNVGIIGCGNISDIYLKNCPNYEYLNVIACSDLDREKAIEKAKEYRISALKLDEMYADKSIDIILNLTIPSAHAEVSLKALQSGKHVYLEKPLSISLEDAKKVIEMANEKKLRVGVAPDTFLGGGIQTCKTLIETGEIGKPIAATAFMMSQGPEGWHPNPDFFYQEGAGPLFDMGPYYLTALINLIGPVKRVTSSAQMSLAERTITNDVRNGDKIRVNTPTHVAGILDFESGAVGTLITSFDIFGGSTLPRIEIYGTQGSMLVPDPNTFDGPIQIKKARNESWEEVTLTHGNTANSRGIGLNDMAAAILNGEEHRASKEMAYHVVEIMQGMLTSSKTQQHYKLTSTCTIPKSLPSKRSECS